MAHPFISVPLKQHKQTKNAVYLSKTDDDSKANKKVTITLVFSVLAEISQKVEEE